MKIDYKEAARYMGFGRNNPDERTMDLMKECEKELLAIAEPRHIYRQFDIDRITDSEITVAGFTMYSRNLARNLKGCQSVYFFAATLGNGPDRLLNRYVRLHIAKAAVLQAVAAAAIEDYCNECQNKLSEELSSQGLFLRPRYSPGYGDLSLSVQPEFLRAIDAQKTVGIILSEGGVMIPEKSVSAIMGVSSVNSSCHIEGCENCSNRDCAYRR